jgi:hypothetical protein
MGVRHRRGAVRDDGLVPRRDRGDDRALRAVLSLVCPRGGPPERARPPRRRRAVEVRPRAGGGDRFPLGQDDPGVVVHRAGAGPPRTVGPQGGKGVRPGGALQRRHRPRAAVLLRDRAVPPVARRGRLRRRRDDPLRPRPRFAVGRGRAASPLFDRAPPDGRDGPPGAPTRPPARVHRRRRDAKSPLGERGGLPSGPGAACGTGRPRPARHRVRRRLAAAAASRAGRPASLAASPGADSPNPRRRLRRVAEPGHGD